MSKTSKIGLRSGERSTLYIRLKQKMVQTNQNGANPWHHMASPTLLSVALVNLNETA